MEGQGPLAQLEVLEVYEEVDDDDEFAPDYFMREVAEESHIDQVEFYDRLKEEGKYVLVATMDETVYPGFITRVGPGSLDVHVLSAFHPDNNEEREEISQAKYRLPFDMIQSVAEDYGRQLPAEQKKVVSWIRRNVLKIAPKPGDEWSDPRDEVPQQKPSEPLTPKRRQFRMKESGE